MTKPAREKFEKWVTDTYPNNLMMRNVLLDSKSFFDVWQAALSGNNSMIEFLNQRIQELAIDALNQECVIQDLRREVAVLPAAPTPPGGLTWKTDGRFCVNCGTARFRHVDLKFCPTPPEVELVAWVEVKDSYEGPYDFHGIKLLGVGKHNLYTSPPSPKAEWDAKGNPLNLMAAANASLDLMDSSEAFDEPEERFVIENLRKFIGGGS